MALTKISTGGVKDDTADEAKLKVSNTGTNGQFLQKQSGNTGGLTWATPPDTNTQVGGNTGADFNNAVKIRLGSDADTSIYHDSFNNTFYEHENASGNVYFRNDGSNTYFQMGTGNEASLTLNKNGPVIASYDGSAKLQTTTTGVTVTGTLAATAVTGDGSGLTNLPPAGNTVDLVADGAIAAGKPVIIKSNGKVAQVAQTATLLTSVTNQATHKLETSSANCERRSARVAYDPDNDVVCKTHVSTGSGISGYHRGTVFVKDTNVNYIQQLGSAATIDTENGGNDGHSSLCYAGNNQFVYVYWAGSQGYTRLRVGTVSGSGNSRSISWGSAQYIDNTSNSRYRAMKAVKMTDGRVAIMAVAANHDCKWSDDRPGMVIVDIASNGTATYRNFTQFDTDTCSSGWNDITMAYNSTDGILLAAWRDTNTVGRSVACKVASGTSATISKTSSLKEITDSNRYQWPLVAWHPTQNKFIYCYNASTSNNNLKTIVATVNSSSLAISHGSVVEKTQNYYYGRNLIVTAQGTVQFWCIDNNKNPYMMADNSFDGSSISWDMEGKPTTYWDGNLEDGVDLVSVDDSTNQYIFANFGASKTAAIVQPVVNATTNLTAHNVIGFAPSAISDGNTGTINTDGNTVTTSGLTAGTRYWITDTGTFQTSVGNTHAGGVALSSTKLLIKMST